MDLWFIFVFILYFIGVVLPKNIIKNASFKKTQKGPKRHKKGRMAGSIEAESSIKGF